MAAEQIFKDCIAIGSAFILSYAGYRFAKAIFDAFND